MHFGTKSYLKSNRNHTAKHTLNEFNESIIELNMGYEHWVG